MKKIEDKYKKLDDITHTLARPGMYIGSIKPHTQKKWIIENDTMVEKEITYNPGFLKLFDEIISNSVDESKREESKLNTIKVTIKGDSISIWDNGGIPVVKHKEHNEWVPEMIFSNLKSGSNFDDDESRTWAGTNGVGSVIVNIFSKEFSVSTCDGKNNFLQIFTNNMRDRSKAKITKSTKKHTEIKYTPDIERFGMENIDENHLKMIEKRVYDIAACNPSLKIYFNDKLINIKTFEDYIKFYKREYFFETNKDKSWSIGVAPSDNGFQQVSFINSIETYDGGTHVDYIMNQIITQLREYFIKKHKTDVKPSDLKNHIFLFLDSTVINPAFSSQTKEKLITEVKNFGTNYTISSKLIQSITKSEIVDSILDWIDKKKSAEENKLQRELNKKLSKIKVDKLIDAKGKDRTKCSLCIFEGESASSNFRISRNKKNADDVLGAFSLRGKFTNVSEITNQKLSKNEEAVNLMASIGLKLGQKAKMEDLRYSKILIYTDADTDGDSITALLINFFYRYWPELFDMGAVYRVQTPLLVAIPKSKSKESKLFFYTNDEYIKWLSKNDVNKYEIKYKKGLGALVGDEYDMIIHNPQIISIKKDELSEKYLDIWFGKDSELRKMELLK